MEATIKDNDYSKHVKVSIVSDNDWHRARKYARRTVNKEDIDKDVSDKFKREMCLSEHSPIREVRFEIEFTDIPVTISQQFSRHRIASIAGDFDYLHETVNPTDVEHYVQSQRPDRTGVPRSEYTNYTFTANIQGLIDMSKKRLCFLASKDARGLWNEVISQIAKIDSEVANVLVKTCVYRGFCPENSSCNFTKSAVLFKQELSAYRTEDFKANTDTFRLCYNDKIGYLKAIDILDPLLKGYTLIGSPIDARTRLQFVNYMTFKYPQLNTGRKRFPSLEIVKKELTFYLQNNQ